MNVLIVCGRLWIDFLFRILYSIRVVLMCGIIWLFICFGYWIGCDGLSLKYLRFSLRRVMKCVRLLMVIWMFEVFDMEGCCKLRMCCMKEDLLIFVVLIMVILKFFMVGEWDCEDRLLVLVDGCEMRK